MPRFRVDYIERGVRRHTVLSSASSGSAKASVERVAGRVVVALAPFGDAGKRRRRLTMRLKALKACFDALGFIMLTGITIDVAVRSLIERLPKGGAREVWIEVQAQIEEGCSLGRAVGSLPRVFSESVVGILSASEAAGRLQDGVKQVSAYLGQTIALREHVRRGLIYPGMLMGLASGVVALLCWYTLPRYQDMLTSMGITHYNSLTAAYFALSDLLRLHAQIVTAGLVVLGALGAVVAARANRSLLDRVVMRLPVVAAAVESVVMTRVCLTFVCLFETGFRPVDILEACARASGNDVFRQGLLGVVRAIESNVSLADAFERSGVFQPECVLAIRSGENDLGRVFRLLGEHYATSAKSQIEVALSLLEPLLLLVVVLVVFGTALAVILPLLDVISSLHS